MPLNPNIPELEPDHPELANSGYMRRDYGAQPYGSIVSAVPFPDDLLIPEVEWQERLREQKAQKTGLLSLREHYGIKSLNQSSHPLCWAFSSTKGVMYCRAKDNQEFKLLSPWYVAGRIKNWRDEGGWSSASIQFIAETGIPTMDLCPSYQRSYDTADTRANAALHRCMKFYECDSGDRSKRRHQMISGLLLGLAGMADYNYISHAMCLMHLESIGPDKSVCDNSWGDDSGDRGLYSVGSHIPDDLLFAGSMTATEEH